MLDSLLLYMGLTLTGAGFISVLRPLRFLRITTRSRAAVVAAGGLLAMAIAFAWPATEKRAAARTMKIDEWMPVWQFDEQHTIHVDAPPERVFAAIHSVPASEIHLFRTLTAIRRLGLPGRESILHAPA